MSTIRFFQATITSLDILYFLVRLLTDTVSKVSVYIHTFCVYLSDIEIRKLAVAMAIETDI